MISTTMSFGKHKGTKVSELPDKYKKWLIEHRPTSNEAIYLKSVMPAPKRKVAVTKTMHKIDNEILKLFDMSGTKCLPIIQRPEGIDPALWGSFIEYLFKHAQGIFPEDKIKTFCGTSNNILSSTVIESFKKAPSKRTPFDICILSFSHGMSFPNFQYAAASKLMDYVKKNEQIFYDFMKNVQKQFPKMTTITEVKKITQLGVTGEADIIFNNTIIDIKCCTKDCTISYKRQLLSYASLYRTSGNSNIRTCKVFNFLTGYLFVMTLENMSDDLAKIILNKMQDEVVVKPPSILQRILKFFGLT